MMAIDLSGQVFGRLTVLQREGTDKWRQPIWLCQCICGSTKIVASTSLRQGNNRSCGCLVKDRIKNRRGAGHPRWKGGIKIEKEGYRMVQEPNHPKAVKGYVLEHRLVMERDIGRYLLPGENVHHKNGVRDDNRIENLELWSTKQPIGQRVEDKIYWANEIIALYYNDWAGEYLGFYDTEAD